LEKIDGVGTELLESHGNGIVIREGTSTGLPTREDENIARCPALRKIKLRNMKLGVENIVLIQLS